MYENNIGYLSRDRIATALAIVREEIRRHSELVVTAIAEDSAAAGRAGIETVMA
jgi:hypothetical protein